MASIIGGITLIGLTIIYTYAFFSARVNEINKTQTKVKSNTLGLIYTGVKDINVSDIIPGDYMTKTFTVENTSNRAVDYNIYMEDVLNEFNNDLIYTLIDQDGVVIEEGPLPVTKSGKTYIKTKVSIDTGVIKSYTLTIKFKYNATESQNTLQGKIFNTTLGIDTEIVNEKKEYEIIADNNVLNILDTGDEIAIGNEHFYVVSNNENTVSAISKYNLYVGGTVNKEYTSYGEEATGIQDSRMKGQVTWKPYYGTTEFANSSMKGTNYSSYSGSLVEYYVNNYVNILNKNLKKLNVSGRLITKAELYELGCTDYYCNQALEWVYLTSYWTATPSGTDYINIVLSNGNAGYTHYSNNTDVGVRPIIEFME